MTQRAVGLFAGAVVMALVVTGCAGGAEPDPQWTAESLGRSPRTASETGYPFDSFHLSETELTQLQEGQAKLLARCAAEYGERVQIVGDYIRPSNDSRTHWGGPFGTETEKYAGSHGYHPSADSPWSFVGGFYIRSVENIQIAFDSKLNTEQKLRQQFIVFGSTPTDFTPSSAPTSGTGLPLPAGGCWSKVEDDINAPLAEFTDLEVDVNNQAIDHPQVKAARHKWVKCMSHAGYDFDSVDAAVGAYSAATLSSAEIDTAVADARCTSSSRWGLYYQSALRSYQRQAVEAKRPQLEAARKAESARLAALRRILER